MSYLVLLFSIWFVWHPLHLSFTSVEVAHEQTQVMVKLFTDDFEHALQQSSGYAVNLQDSLFTTQEQDAVEQYIHQHLTLSVKSKKLDLTYKQVKQNHEATWLYFAIDPIPKQQSLTIHNSLMNDIFHDQRNLLIVSANTTEKALRFTRSHTVETIILE